MAKSRKDILNKIDELAFVRFYEEEKKYPLERLKKGYYFMCVIHHHERIEDIIPHRLKAVFDKKLVKSNDKEKELMLIAAYAKSKFYAEAAEVYEVSKNSRKKYANLYKEAFESFCEELRQRDSFYLASVDNFYDASWIKHLTLCYLWNANIKEAHEIVKRLETTQELNRDNLLNAIIEDAKAVRTLLFFTRNYIEPEMIDGTEEPDRDDEGWSENYIDMWYDEQENYLERDDGFFSKLVMGCDNTEEFLKTKNNKSIYEEDKEVLMFAYTVKEAIKRISKSPKTKEWHKLYWNREIATKVMIYLFGFQ